MRDHGPLEPPALHALAAGLAEGLEAIHSCGLTHRDLKPDNIILGADGPRIIDFGIARAPDAMRVTRTGTPVGTPSYMSPEQTEGVPVGPASDMFSLGTVLAYAATGANPFAGPSLASVVRRLIGPMPDLEGVPTEELRSLVLSCWHHDPDRRPSPTEVLSRFADTDLSDAWPPAPPAAFAVGATKPMATEVLAPLPPTLVVTAVPGTGSTTALAALARKARRADEAEEPRAALLAHRALAADNARVLGPHHPDTLLCRQSTAFWLGRAGDLRGAVDALRDLEEECSRVLGSDHESTLKAREDLAYWKQAALETPPL